MTKLYIDNVACPLAERVKLPSYNLARHKSVEAWREGEQMTFTIESTPETDAMFAMARDLYHSHSFNDTYHHARLEAEGVTLFEGVATLLATEHNDEGCTYRVKVRNGGAEWAKQAALTRIDKCGIEYDGRLTLTEIERSWTEKGSVCFLPLLRDSYKELEDGQLHYKRQWLMMAHDYYPFISVRAIIEATLRKSGYKLRSTFLDSELFGQLYISGAYHHTASDAAYAAMGFKAYRTRTTTGQADALGRINIWSPENEINIGCIVDSITPGVMDDEGTTHGDAHAYGGCLTIENGFPEWRPKREIRATFDYHISYTTEYRIASRHRLRGFDRLRLGVDTYVELCLTNPYKDYRDELTPQMNYTIMLFDGYDDQNSYFLPGFGQITSRVAKMVSADDCPTSTTLYYCEPSGEEYLPYEGEWAIFRGYVEERGTVRVDVDVRSAYGHYTPTSPERFHHIYFEGAEQGQRITLHSGCSVSPVFGGVIGTGERFSFDDIANLDYSVGGLMEAVAQMFNLRMMTHKPSKTLYIEPYDDFTVGDIVDWRARQLDGASLGQSVVESFETTRYGYQPGDGIVNRMADVSGEVIGQWSYHIDGYAAKEGLKSCANPLFAPTADMQGICDTAPSASVLVAGDRDKLDIEHNLSPRIVLYHGTVPLPEGETWPALNDPKSYPLAYFHGPTVGKTLCFEDRDGCMGLHHYHERELRERAEREELHCSIHLSPLEYASLFDPQSAGATLRSRFRLGFDGQTSLFRLQSIDSYDVDSHTAECTFQRTLTD